MTVKIDFEGVELDVLSGGGNVSTIRPFVQIEMSEDSDKVQPFSLGRRHEKIHWNDDGIDLNKDANHWPPPDLSADDALSMLETGGLSSLFNLRVGT